MIIYKIIFTLFAASLPIVVLVVVGRLVISAVRSLRDRRFRFALFSVLAIAGILLLFSGVAVVWFVYGVGHSSKELWSELVLIALSAVTIHGGSYGLWRLARHMDQNPERVAD
jgi:hypothetical protein